MKLLRDVWAQNTIKGHFKGSLEDFALKNFNGGNPLYAGARKIQSIFELMAMDSKTLYLAEEIEDIRCRTCGKKCATKESCGEGFCECGSKKCASSKGFRGTAGVKAKANIDCPHCKMTMKGATLANGLGTLYCPNCRHVDYEDGIKSNINAGSPSVDKSLHFKYIDSGNCQIA